MSAIDYPAAVYDAVLSPRSLEQLRWMQDVLESIEAPYIRSGNRLVTFLAAARRLAGATTEELSISLLTTTPQKHLRMVRIQPQAPSRPPTIRKRPSVPRSHVVPKQKEKPARGHLRMVRGQAQLPLAFNPACPQELRKTQGVGEGS